MLANLRMTKGVIFSQMVLLKLIEKGISREGAYAIVQRNAMRSWQEGLEFRDLLLQDGEVVSRLNADDLEGAFQVGNFVKQVDFIFNRVFGEKP
jgi:adenylosuccinate lyase